MPLSALLTATKERPVPAILAVAAGITPVLAVFAPRGLTPLAVVAALCILGLTLGARQRPAGIDPRLIALIAALCIWAAVSALWAADAWLAARGALKFAGNALTGILLVGAAARLAVADARLVCAGLTVGFAVAFGLIAFEVIFSGPISRFLWSPLPDIRWYGFFWFNSAAVVLSLLVWPLTFVLWRRHGPVTGLLLFVLTVVLVSALSYSTATAALVAGAAAWAAAYWLRRRAAWILAALFAAAILAAPVVPSTVLKPESIAGTPDGFQQAFLHRLYIWRFTAERIADHPLRGWGMNASRTMPGAQDHAVDPERGDLGENLPLHPHNAALQAWLELGLPGAILVALFAAVVMHVATQGGRAAVAARLGQIGTALAIASGSFSLWSSWWISTLWLTAALTTLITRDIGDGHA